MDHSDRALARAHIHTHDEHESLSRPLSRRSESPSHRTCASITIDKSPKRSGVVRCAMARKKSIHVAIFRDTFFQRARRRHRGRFPVRIGEIASLSSRQCALAVDAKYVNSSSSLLSLFLPRSLLVFEHPRAMRRAFTFSFLADARHVRWTF